MLGPARMDRGGMHPGGDPLGPFPVDVQQEIDAVPAVIQQDAAPPGLLLRTSPGGQTDGRPCSQGVELAVKDPAQMTLIFCEVGKYPKSEIFAFIFSDFTFDKACFILFNLSSSTSPRKCNVR